jgi:hypothetical protein
MIRILGLAVALIAASAEAETIPPYPKAPAERPALSLMRPDLMRPVAPVAMHYAQAPAPLPRGVARTSVERSEGGITGSAGVLCGLKPNADASTIGTARGYDSDGRFVGAKLAFSF